MRLGLLLGTIFIAGSLGIVSNAPKLLFPQPVLPGGQIGIPYIETLTATGGVTPYKWMDDSPETLPPGLTLGQATGVISGTPTQTGIFNLHIQVADSEKPAQRVQRNVPMSVGVASTPAD